MAEPRAMLERLAAVAVPKYDTQCPLDPGLDFKALAQQRPPSLELERSTIPATNGMELPISVISKDRLEDLVKRYPHSKRLQHPEYCAQRAHTIGHTLGELGIETQKLVVWPRNQSWGPDYVYAYDTTLKDQFGHLPRWKEHIVNLIKVKDESQGSVSVYVIDPAVSRLPIPMEDWRKIFQRTVNGELQDSIDKNGVFHRANLAPNLRTTNTEYDEEDRIWAYQVMAGNDGKPLTH